MKIPRWLETTNPEDHWLVQAVHLVLIIAAWFLIAVFGALAGLFFIGQVGRESGGASQRKGR